MNRSFTRFAATAALTLTNACATTRDIRANEDRTRWRRMEHVSTRVLEAAREEFGDAAVDESPDITWRFGVLEGETIRAFGAASLSDGSIGIDVEFLDALRDDELAVVLAHEVSHVLRGHARDRLAVGATSCALGGGGIVAGFIVLPIWGGVLAALGVETARELAVTAYTRSQEYEADADALHMLRHAGYDDIAVVRALEVTAEYVVEQFATYPDPTIFDTHPSIAERIAALEALRTVSEE